jgi:hypothetical protein
MEHGDSSCQIPASFMYSKQGLARNTGRYYFLQCFCKFFHETRVSEKIENGKQIAVSVLDKSKAHHQHLV